MENWHGGIPRHKSRSSMNMNYNILFQRELFHHHKYFTLWLNVTHLWALFPPKLLLLGSLLKNCFDAIQPFISPLPLCNPGAILCCVFFSSSPKRHITTKKTHTHAPAMSLWALGFVPPASVLRMSNAVTVNRRSPRLRHIF